MSSSNPMKVTVVPLPEVWSATCATCGGPYEPAARSPFHQVLDPQGRPLCAACVTRNFPQVGRLLDMIAEHVIEQHQGERDVEIDHNLYRPILDTVLPILMRE